MNNAGIKGAHPHAVENLPVTFDTPKLVIPGYTQGIGPRTLPTPY